MVKLNFDKPSVSRLANITLTEPTSLQGVLDDSYYTDVGWRGRAVAEVGTLLTISPPRSTTPSTPWSAFRSCWCVVGVGRESRALRPLFSFSRHSKARMRQSMAPSAPRRSAT